jgi:hypothetical protein
MASAWPYRLDLRDDGLGLTFAWGRREIPWSAVDGFRYLLFRGVEPMIPGVSGVFVRLRYRRTLEARARFAVATFWLPTMDDGSSLGEPIYVTVLDRHIPGRRLAR